MEAIARELGVRRQTLLAWAVEPAADAGPAFVPVSVVADARGTGIVVHAPGGLRIEGLDVLPPVVYFGAPLNGGRNFDDCAGSPHLVRPPPHRTRAPTLATESPG